MSIRVATFNAENLFARFRFDAGVDPSTVSKDGWTVEKTAFHPLSLADKELTGAAVKELDADVLCLQEVENVDTLKHFRSRVLGGPWPPPTRPARDHAQGPAAARRPVPRPALPRGRPRPPQVLRPLPGRHDPHPAELTGWSSRSTASSSTTDGDPPGVADGPAGPGGSERGNRTTWNFFRTYPAYRPSHPSTDQRGE
ncbi:hypothetical protein ACN3XK_67200, partial [Actinomadura welshii]